jgi:tetratricopeptide (TPR) repeat protein
VFGAANEPPRWIDIKLGLRAALNALGEAPGRILDHLRRAETLAQTLGDQRRLGQVYADLGATCWKTGDVDRTVVYSQRALAVAATLGPVGLQARAHVSLGRAYYEAGDYRRAIESLGRNVATLRGALRYERFGTNGSVAVTSRAWLSLCHAELGAFTEGLAMAEGGLRIAETVNEPFSLMNACHGVGVVSRRQGDMQWAIPGLEQAMGLCQDWPIPLLWPIMAAAWAWRMPWVGVSPWACPCRHAPAPGALSPRPWHLVCQARQGRTSTCGTLDRHGIVLRDGRDLLAAPDGGGAGAGGMSKQGVLLARGSFS